MHSNAPLSMPAAPHDLLTSFLCTPVCMQPDRFAALIQRLNQPLPLHLQTQADYQRVSPTLREKTFAQLLARAAKTDATDGDAGDDDDDEDDVMPWEEPLYTIENGVATLQVSGPLVKGYDPMTCCYYRLMSTDRLQEAVTELTGRADVFAVVFEFNSPGGMATGTPETAEMILTLGQTKMTIGYTSDQAASAAYWMLSACRVVLTTPSATVGSIGTYLALYDFSEYLADWGIKLELFRAGMYKGIGVMGKSLTADERKFLQGAVNDINGAFTGFVKERRNGVTDDTMQGQWFSGAAAVARKLADACVGSRAEAMANLRLGGGLMR